ncbi:hypothetical protein CCR80_10595 [Rhodothalassium salexigens]|uniref:MotA/TolQ/ExbB proton channel family protein n=1 Tax=Rhodothalassium salexigens TaxID=1086 RepID=UPI0019145CCE|nr:MotA/TolQ/ExbB proton channel family protein [Rhodothalassium salexigens]MBK5921477.1 hypothetical protein [Rhodothalassium salexigens]
MIAWTKTATAGLLGVMALAATPAARAQAADPAATAAPEIARPDAAEPADPAATVETLLRQIRTGQARETASERARLARFVAERDRRAALLAEAEAELAAARDRATRLETAFTENELDLERMESLLRQRMGTFGELFGTVREVSGKAASALRVSPVNAQSADRVAFLSRLARDGTVPSVTDLERLWYELQRETVELGRVVRFEAPVIRPTGATEITPVTRIGPFTATAGGRFLAYLPGDRVFLQQERQPNGPYTGIARRFEAAADTGAAIAPAVLDPSSGAILSRVVQAPDFLEQLQQAGVIGYVLIALAAVGFVIALERIVTLSLVMAKTRRQLRHPDRPQTGNPLGRVLAVAPAHWGGHGTDELDYHLAEVIMKERARFDRGLNLVKVIVAAAPLMGLLGTVTGMIQTFELMALFGAGDPQLMAGGISQALVTTMLGLMAAIPLLILHALAKGRSDTLVEILEEQSAGLVAEHAALPAPGEPAHAAE